MSDYWAADVRPVCAILEVYGLLIYMMSQWWDPYKSNRWDFKWNVTPCIWVFWGRVRNCRNLWRPLPLPPLFFSPYLAKKSRPILS